MRRPPAGWLLRRCLGAGAAQPVWPLPAQGGSGGPEAHLGSPRPPAPGSERGRCPALAESVRSHRRSGAAKANTAPRRRYVSGWGGRAWAPRRDTPPGPRTGPPPLRQAPVSGTCRRASPKPPASFPPSSVPLTVHLHPRRGYRPFRLRASEERRGEPSELLPPPRRCYRPPTPSLPARPFGPRFAIAAEFCHCLRLCSRCFFPPACSEATPTVRSHSPLAPGPRPGPGGGRGLIRAGGVAGRIGWSSRPAAAACRGHC